MCRSHCIPEELSQKILTFCKKDDILCIADEIQTGFGRIGTHFWAFERDQIVSDMVSSGKPIANGYPLAALVVKSQVSNSFCAGKRTYFNTFGGAPVSMTAGLAVLDVIENDNLQQLAQEVGAYLKQKLQELQLKHWLYVDVRGQGLLVGFELIRNKDTLEPGTKEADELQVRMMKENRVLVNLDGKFNSVIKIEPPMCFSKKDADNVFKSADRILGEIEARLKPTGKHTK